MLKEQNTKFSKNIRNYSFSNLTSKGHLLSNFSDNVFEWLFPCVHFNRLNALDDFIQNANSGIRLFDHAIAVGSGHFSNSN